MHRVDDLESGLEILFGFTREADNEIAANGDVRTGGAHLLDNSEIGFNRVTAVHDLKDAVAAGLNRKVKIGHQLLNFAVRADQLVGHVGRMTCRVAEAFERIDFGKLADQIGKAATLIPPGVHILPKQHDFPSAAVDEQLSFGKNVAPRARDFRAPRIRDDAISAEFVAALLNCEESRWRRSPSLRKRVELAERRHVGVDRSAAK